MEHLEIQQEVLVDQVVVVQVVKVILQAQEVQEIHLLYLLHKVILVVKVKDSQIIYLAVVAVVPLKAVLTLLVVLVHLVLQAATEQLRQFLVLQQHLLVEAQVLTSLILVKAVGLAVDLAGAVVLVKQELQTQAVDLAVEALLPQVILVLVDLES